MIYLTTGANGAGKTLITLRDVRAQQLKESRPVFYNGFEMDPAKEKEFGWQKFNPEKWQDLPDGAICIWDECQEQMPAGSTVKNEPEWLTDIAKYRRKRGMDFWLITQHPSLISPTVRRLIGSPSWHRHLKRAFGASVVSELKFSTPDLRCEDPGAGARATVTMVSYPKEVFEWYKSASLHTGKTKIPRQVYVVAVAVLAVPVLAYATYRVMWGNVMAKAPPGAISGASATAVVTPAAKVNNAGPAPVKTTAEYLAGFTPRIPGLPHTAPVYDGVTAPAVAPYPAACISMGKRCECYTQQATRLQTPHDVCVQIAANGFFIAWQQPLQGGLSPVTSVQTTTAPAKPADLDTLAFMAKRRPATP